jgi:hypothetical protein
MPKVAKGLRTPGGRSAWLERIELCSAFAGLLSGLSHRLAINSPIAASKADHRPQPCYSNPALEAEINGFYLLHVIEGADRAANTGRNWIMAPLGCRNRIRAERSE